MLQPGDMSVDLTLAVNYVPAALCLIRVLIFTTCICLIGPGEELGGYQILGLVLYMDRVVLATFTQRTIFDSNAVIAAVFFSNIFATIRAYVTDTRVTFLTVVVHLWWVLTCGLMLVEPARVTKIFEKRHRVYHLIPATVTVVALVALSMLHMAPEPAWAKMVRAMGFAVLSVGWVYIVGTQKMHGPHTEASSHFIARFAPVLFCPGWISALFAVGAVGCLCYQYYELFVAPFAATAKPGPESTKLDQPQPKSNPTLVVSPGSHEPDIEEAFRLAKAAQASSSKPQQV